MMNEKMGTSLQTMTMALSVLACSTPRLTSSTIAQFRREMKTTPRMVRLPANGG